MNGLYHYYLFQKWGNKGTGPVTCLTLHCSKRRGCHSSPGCLAHCALSWATSVLKASAGASAHRQQHANTFWAVSPSAFRSSQSSVQSRDYIRKSPYWERINLLSMILCPDSQLTQDSTASQEEHHRKSWKNNPSPWVGKDYGYISPSPPPPPPTPIPLPHPPYPPLFFLGEWCGFGCIWSHTSSPGWPPFLHFPDMVLNILSLSQGFSTPMLPTSLARKSRCWRLNCTL